MNVELTKFDWIEEGAVRLCEEGHVFTGEVLVVPRTDDGLVERLEELAELLLSLEWKVYDIVVVPVRSTSRRPARSRRRRRWRVGRLTARSW